MAHEAATGRANARRVAVDEAAAAYRTVTAKRAANKAPTDKATAQQAATRNAAATQAAYKAATGKVVTDGGYYVSLAVSEETTVSERVGMDVEALVRQDEEAKSHMSREWRVWSMRGHHRRGVVGVQKVGRRKGWGVGAAKMGAKRARGGTVVKVVRSTVEGQGWGNRPEFRHRCRLTRRSN